MKASLTRAQRRRFEALGEAVDRVTQGDAAFFERFPARSHRVRLASSAEIEQNAILAEPSGSSLAPGERWLVLVKQLDVGVRLRAFATGIGFDDFDFSEAEARDLYDEKVRPGSYMHRIEAQMRAALAKRRAMQ